MKKISTDYPNLEQQRQGLLRQLSDLRELRRGSLTEQFLTVKHADGSKETISLLDRVSSRRDVAQSSAYGSNNPECVGQCAEPTRSSLCAAAFFPAALKISGLRVPAKSHFYLVHPASRSLGSQIIPTTGSAYRDQVSK
jgi:hypothetical protein